MLADADLVQTTVEIAFRLIAALRHDRRIFLFGNGGSAADAQHIAAELVGRYRRQRPGLPAMALTVNTSSLTAIANDYSFDSVFARQIEALGSAGDLAVAISTSGMSRNVLVAAEAAKSKGMVTVGMTGRTGGQLREIVDWCLCIPSDETPRVQECHILVGHILCEIVETELFGPG
ncbi:MAG TPA: D-sedoheptulose 7-phosphate isomerase [Myxococcota bacterium]|nr:D-sedoheptulose 7-phosphate isomerase [Myxococcota bacterium]